CETCDRIAGQFEQADGLLALQVSNVDLRLADGSLIVLAGSVSANIPAATGADFGICGEFVGGTGIWGHGRGDSFYSNGVRASIGGPMGRPLLVEPYQGENPHHGAILIQRSRMPSNPSDGEIYRDWNSGILRYYSDAHGR